MSVYFCKRISNGKVLPSTFVATHWRRLTKEGSLKNIDVVFPKNNTQQLNWKEEIVDKDTLIASLILGESVLFSLNLQNGDYLVFFYDYPESPTVLHIREIFDDEGMQIIDTNKSRGYNKYIFQIPIQYQESVEDIINVEADGKCGYTCLARLIGRDGAHEAIQTELLEEICSQKELYTMAFGNPDYTDLLDRLKTPGRWMDTRTGLVAAMRYVRPVIQLGLNLSTTYIPTLHMPSEASTPISYAHINNNHFVMVTLKTDSIIPRFSSYPLTGYDKFQSLWVEHFKDRVHAREPNVARQVIVIEEDREPTDVNSNVMPGIATEEDRAPTQEDRGPAQQDRAPAQEDPAQEDHAMPDMDGFDNVKVQRRREEKVVTRAKEKRWAPVRYEDEYMSNTSQYRRKKSKKNVMKCESINKGKHTLETSESNSKNNLKFPVVNNGYQPSAVDQSGPKIENVKDNGYQPSAVDQSGPKIENAKDNGNQPSFGDAGFNNDHQPSFGDVGFNNDYQPSFGDADTDAGKKNEKVQPSKDEELIESSATGRPSMETIAELVVKVVEGFKINEKEDAVETTLNTSDVLEEKVNLKNKGIKIVQILKSVYPDAEFDF